MSKPGHLPACIDNLVAAMQGGSPVRANVLTSIIEQVEIDFEALAPLGAFDHDPTLSYGRRCLWQSAHMGIYLMAWNPGDFTALHGHGHAEWGAVVFGGDAAHRSYRVEGNAVKRISSQSISKGSVLGVCRGDYYHAMGNSGTTPFLTLHIYGAYRHQGPSTDDARVFELEKDCISLTEGSAYVNMADAHRKSMTKGIKTDPETYADYLDCIRPFYARLGMELPG